MKKIIAIVLQDFICHWFILFRITLINYSIQEMLLLVKIRIFFVHFIFLKISISRKRISDFCYSLFLFTGQLNRPSVTPSDDVLVSNNEEFTTEQDGTLVSTSFFLIVLFIFLLEFHFNRNEYRQ